MSGARGVTSGKEASVAGRAKRTFPIFGKPGTEVEESMPAKKSGYRTDAASGRQPFSRCVGDPHRCNTAVRKRVVFAFALDVVFHTTSRAFDRDRSARAT